MDDALRPIDLDRRPVGLHGGDLAAGNAPQHRCNSAQGAGRLRGNTKVVGVGRLWKTYCAPLISIVAPSVSMEVILPPEMRHSRPAPFRWSSGRVATGDLLRTLLAEQ
jgi:hypothetical protein